MRGVTPLPPVPLNPEHDISVFNSGVKQLDDWLKQKAICNKTDGASRSFVACAGLQVIGYTAWPPAPFTAALPPPFPGSAPALAFSTTATRCRA